MVNPGEEHRALFTQAGLMLGKILWHLLDAAQEMDRRTILRRPAASGWGYTPERTAFGTEVGNDEIYWWVYKKEPDVGELRIEVERTLASVQQLLEQVKSLDASRVQTYRDLVHLISDFVETCRPQIGDLYRFVVWLGQRDRLAPSILFTYRVWGSTRRSDRWLELSNSQIDSEPDVVVERLTVISCGLAKQERYTRFSVEMDLRAALYDSDPEGFHDRSVPESVVMSRTAYQAIGELTAFIQELRDSLRNIELDIGKYLAQRFLLKSEVFWANFITKAKSPHRVESSLWDFKETLPMWHARGVAAQKEQIDFCRLVAAFANKDGGAIIIGVGDRPREVLGVPNLENRMKSVARAIRKWVEYWRLDAMVHLQPVPVQEKGTTVVCLVVAVAQTETIVGVKGATGEYYYPDREQAGIENGERQELETRKAHLKSGINYGFIESLDDFLHDK